MPKSSSQKSEKTKTSTQTSKPKPKKSSQSQAAKKMDVQNHSSRNVWYVVAIVILIIAIAATLITQSTNKQSNDNQNTTQSKQIGDNIQAEIVPQVQPQTTIDDQRNAIEQYLQSPFDPETVDLAGFNGDSIARGAKFRITIEYSNAGDSNWTDGFVKISHGNGLELMTDTIVDEFGGQRNEINPSRYNSSERVLEYGPGTSNANTSSVNAGQSGRVSFVVQAKNDAEVGSKQRIISYLTGENEKIGNIDVYYLEIKE